MLTSNVQLGYERGEVQAVQGGLSCPPPLGQGKTNWMLDLNICLTEIMLTSLTTKYSKIMVQEELTDDTVWPKSWAGAR